MKKLLIFFFIIFLLGFSYSPFSKYNEYIGKNIKIETIDSIGTIIRYGELHGILTMEMCDQEDGFHNCINKRYYHILILKQEKSDIFIPEEDVFSIEEIK